MSKDVGMTAKILQLVNSAYFGVRWHVSSPIHAARLLGLETIKALVLSYQVFSQFNQNRLKGFSLENLLKHSITVGSFAKLISDGEQQEQSMSTDALVAGHLHDAGKLVFAENLPEQYGKTLALAKTHKIPIWEAELETLGATHTEVGAYLLGIWCLPDPIVEAVAFHHQPKKFTQQNFSPLTAVHVADVLASEEQTSFSEFTIAAMDCDYLGELGLSDRLTQWRESCQKALQKATRNDKRDFLC